MKVSARIGGAQHFFWPKLHSKLSVIRDNRLWQIDPVRPARGNWIDITPRGFQSWLILAEAKRSNGLQVIVSPDRNPAAPDLYATKPDGSGKILVERNDGSTLSCVLDHNNVPVVRIDRIDEEYCAYFYRASQSEPWREFARVHTDDTLTIHVALKSGLFQALSNRGRDRTALVMIDPTNGVESVVLEHSSVDITEIHQFSSGSEADLAVIHDGFPEYVGLTDRGRCFTSLLSGLGERLHAEPIGFSADGRFATVSVSADGCPYDVYLFDLVATTARKISQNALNKRRGAFSRTRPIAFPARDGLSIPGLLTLPPNIKPERLPAVVLVHGGPAGRDLYQFDRDKQLLSSRGYIVLSVNFRGSTGYGKRFQAAGYREFGRAMHNDIADAAKWLVEQGMADPGAIGVMGGSYGGYQAAFAMVRDPDVFQSAIVEYAATDLKYQMENNPSAWGLNLAPLQRYFGKLTNPEDVTALVERSPITHADRIRGSVLITAGKLDLVVGFEQSEALERALKSSGKDVTAIYFEKEGHGYSRWQTNVIRARAIEEFLARTLGGRCERFDIISRVAKWSGG
ncbi:peptidase S9 [Rhizobium anhuiense]|uniref:Peptidase S9 n=1 Tax=Rhizobium anhuiense TaxID=1184720 RepID=A0ABX4J022_9HYPH|nr:peptidase S9 [Rhizobium anhuiense]PDS47836.1 peptidase S9 [Rhizobium anhuiense]